MNPLPMTATGATIAIPSARRDEAHAGTLSAGNAQASSVPNGNTPDGSKLSGSAHEFESMAIGEFLQPMFSSVDDTNNLFGGGEAEGILKPMLVSEFAKLMEQKGGLGLEPIIEQKMRELSQATGHRR